jgi:antitoxin CptB
MSESAEHRLKRLHMRSIRRGIKEMDLILTAFSTRQLAGLDGATLDLYEAFLEESDHDLYQWVSGQVAPPQHYENLLGLIKSELPGVTGKHL